MNETAKLIDAHLTLYPDLQPEDIYKLVYQNEFGGGHLINDLNECRDRIISELYCTRDDKLSPLYTDIGNSRVRLEMKNPEVRALGADTLCRIFACSSERMGTVESFEKKLDEVSAHLASKYPFMSSHFNNYIKDRRREKYPAVSHSEKYRQLYSPSYRVINSEYLRLIPLFVLINKVLAAKPTAVIALDGHCASGKTTAASLISGVYDANVIHTDDFFLPQDMRTPERLNQPGGNVHYERLKDEVIAGIRSGRAFSYRIFGCSDMDFLHTAGVLPKPLTIIEGAYSTHPALDFKYDIVCFFDIAPDEQERRILLRNGQQMLERFRNKWIPLENRYFDFCRIKETSDLIIK
ncbi:MAG: hypothetical protein GX051_01770 [Clostridiales bacterium]|jgi:uridine kinase|nr:hypothetical protein [Clostridiales bacterium]